MLSTWMMTCKKIVILYHRKIGDLFFVGLSIIAINLCNSLCVCTHIIQYSNLVFFFFFFFFVENFLLATEFSVKVGY